MFFTIFSYKTYEDIQEGLVWNAEISQESVQFYRENAGTGNIFCIPNRLEVVLLLSPPPPSLNSML